MRALPTASLAAIALLSAAVPAGAADNPWLERRPLNIAHQGGEQELPSNTLYALKEAVKAGADMLEIDVGVTKDDQVIVMHDTTVDRVTNGRGTVSSLTLRRIRRLDGAYWFSGGSRPYARNKRVSAYRFRGIATGKRRPPKGYKATDFRVPTLREVLRAFPGTPINIEIKGRTPKEAEDEYIRNAEVLARLLRGTRRRDLIVVSFRQKAVDRFHELAPRIPVAPGIDGAAAFLLGGGSPGDGVVALQMPLTFRLGDQLLDVTTPENVARAHQAGYAWHVWLSNDGESPATWRRLLDWCVDGVMTARPRAFERVLRGHRPPASCASR
jgi:glycerophosphoryl diester phosphodiesterase